MKNAWAIRWPAYFFCCFCENCGIVNGKGKYEEDMYETGYKEGERRINALYEKLLKEQRMDDMKRAVEDEAYRETLLKEYDL